MAREAEFSSGNSATATRKSEIEKVMRADIDRCFREGLDRELAGLIEDEEAEADPDIGDPTSPMAPDVSRNALCGSHARQALVDEWTSLGGLRPHLEAVQRDVGGIVRELGDNRSQRVFMAKFDRDVPEAARYAML